MPLIVNKHIFTLVPRMSPWIIRPLLRYVFNSLIDMLATPRLQIQAKLVRLHFGDGSYNAWYLLLGFAPQIEDHLEKGGEWFAGGQGPTFADYMMIFPLEAWYHDDPEALGPKTREYVERIHRR